MPKSPSKWVVKSKEKVWEVVKQEWNFYKKSLWKREKFSTGERLKRDRE